MYSEPSSGIKLTAYSCSCWLFHRIYYDAWNHKHKIFQTKLSKNSSQNYSAYHQMTHHVTTVVHVQSVKKHCTSGHTSIKCHYVIPSACLPYNTKLTETEKNGKQTQFDHLHKRHKASSQSCLNNRNTSTYSAASFACPSNF